VDSYKVAAPTVVKLLPGNKSKQENKKQNYKGTGNYFSTVNLSKKYS
jgi:uncharacterized UPF0146 family protein